MESKQWLWGGMIHHQDKICDGLRLFNGKLVYPDGKVIRQWKSGYLGIIVNGYYYAQLGYEKKKWGKYTLDDRVIWEKNEAIHHDILVLKDKVITFTKECRKYKGRAVDFDVIVEYDLQGIETDRWSTWENLKYLKRFHQPLELDLPKLPFFPDIVPPKKHTPWGGNYDYYRLNAMSIIPLNEKKFMEGHWLLTIRHGSMLLVLNQKKEVVWKSIYKDIKGNLEGPHGAQVLPNGNILVFDNGRYRGQSRVIEIDPLTKNIIWEYTNKDFFTRSQGYAQRLPNGNTLITESEKGHAFEITTQGEIVWEFFNPDTQNDPNFPQNRGTREWIYRMIWYPYSIL